MFKKILALITFFYILTLFQISFLAHFSIFGIVLNLILIFVILINLFESSQNYLGIFSAFAGGFFLDIFSADFIGYQVLILVGAAILIKTILKRYVRNPI